MYITNDDGTPLSPADLLELSDLLQHPGQPGLNDRPSIPCSLEQLRSDLAAPIPPADQPFWAQHAATTAQLASITSPADDD